MIHTDARVILPSTLELLRNLQTDSRLDHFFLVGGTALALHLGHRLSIDLDFFSLSPFETAELEAHLSSNFDFYTDYVATNTLKGFIEDIKIDFITHAYPLAEPLQQPQRLRLASVKDIGAMKLNAIAHSGQRQKDFFDLYFLLEHVPLQDLLNAYEVKYSHSSLIIPLKALTWFEDIDFEIEKPMLTRKVTFDQVKQRLTQATNRPGQIFK